MFYTKYRPQKFSEISQPNDTAVALMNQVKTKKTVHAYLFVGSRGTGKTTTARILAKALNCEHITEVGDPCAKCDACVAVKDGTFLDLIEIDAASNRGIDDIRDLRNRVTLAPSAGKTKVYIIDEVHMLTTEAFNALLKTLEEPPAHCVFILCTTELHKVPSTIKSRCQVFKFKRATVPQLVEKLGTIAKKEKAKVTKKELESIAKASSGGFRDAETMLQQVIEGGISVEALLSVSAKEDYADFVEALLEKDANTALRHVNKVSDDGLDLYVWVGELLDYLQDLLFVKAKAHEGVVEATKGLLDTMEQQAEKFDTKTLVYTLESFLEAQNEVKSSAIAKLPLEIAIAKLCMGGDYDPEDFIEPLDSGDGDRDLLEEEKDVVEEKVSVAKVKAVDVALDLECIKEKWAALLEEVTQFNSSVQALLKSCVPVDVTGNCVHLEAVYSFHKERLESSKNRQIVEQALLSVFGVPITIKCQLGKKDTTSKKRLKETGELTDYNVEAPPVPEEILSGSVVDIFDGSLPLV